MAGASVSLATAYIQSGTFCQIHKLDTIDIETVIARHKIVDL